MWRVIAADRRLLVPATLALGYAIGLAIGAGSRIRVTKGWETKMHTPPWENKLIKRDTLDLERSPFVTGAGSGVREAERKHTGGDTEYVSPLDGLTRTERDVLFGDWILPSDVKALRDEGRPLPARPAFASQEG